MQDADPTSVGSSADHPASGIAAADQEPEPEPVRVPVSSALFVSAPEQESESDAAAASLELDSDAPALSGVAAASLLSPPQPLQRASSAPPLSTAATKIPQTANARHHHRGQAAAAIDAMGLGATLGTVEAPARSGKRQWFARARRAKRAAQRAAAFAAILRGMGFHDDDAGDGGAAAAADSEGDDADAEDVSGGGGASALPPPPPPPPVQLLPDAEVLTAATLRSPLARIAPDRICFVTMLACISGRDLAALTLCSRFWRARGEDKELTTPLWQYYHYHEFVQRVFAEDRRRNILIAYRHLRHRHVVKPRSIWEYLQRNAAQRLAAERAAFEAEEAAARHATAAARGTWLCDRCTLINGVDDERCVACSRNQSRSKGGKGAPPSAPPGPGLPPPPGGPPGGTRFTPFWHRPMLQQRTNGVRDRRKLTEMIAASTPEPMMSGSGVDRKGRYRRAYARQVRKRKHTDLGPFLVRKVKGERDCRGVCRGAYVRTVICANHIGGAAIAFCILALAPVCFLAQLVARDSYGVVDADPFGRSAWVWLLFLLIPMLIWVGIFALFCANRLASYCFFFCHNERITSAAYLPDYRNAPMTVAIDSAVGFDHRENGGGGVGDKGPQAVPMLADTLLWGAGDFIPDSGDSSDCCALNCSDASSDECLGLFGKCGDANNACDRATGGLWQAPPFSSQTVYSSNAGAHYESWYSSNAGAHTRGPAIRRLGAIGTEILKLCCHCRAIPNALSLLATMACVATPVTLALAGIWHADGSLTALGLQLCLLPLWIAVAACVLSGCLGCCTCCNLGMRHGRPNQGLACLKYAVNAIACALLFYPVLQAVFIAIHLGVGDNKAFSLAVAFIPTWILYGAYALWCGFVLLYLIIIVILNSYLWITLLINRDCNCPDWEDNHSLRALLGGVAATVLFGVLAPLVVGPGLFLFFSLSPDPVVQSFDWPAWSSLIVTGIVCSIVAVLALVVGVVATIKTCGSEQLTERVHGFTGSTEARLKKWKSDLSAIELEEANVRSEVEKEEEEAAAVAEGREGGGGSRGGGEYSFP